jgi:zinc transport system ATP-binding protein
MVYMDAIVELNDVWLRFDGKVILENITLVVDKNDFLGIIGPNGGGKTSLLKVILGLIKPNQGEVKVFGGPPQKNRKSIGYVPQLGRFDMEFPALVRDVIATGRLGPRKLLRGYSRKDKELVEKVLRDVDMVEFKDRHIGSLSGGEIQRVFIARALVSDPKLLLLDEPTASVDKLSDTKFWEFLNILKEVIPIILVTHDISAVSTYVEKIACLNRKLFYNGTKQITPEMWEETYKCPVDMIAHGLPHRVVQKHG